MNAHTPGPWQLGSETRGQGDGSLVGQFIHGPTSNGGGIVAEAFGNCMVKTDAQVRANARLIAAAPQLLARVQKEARECEHCDGTGRIRHPAYGGNGRSAITDCQRCAGARALIDLATKP